MNKENNFNLFELIRNWIINTKKDKKSNKNLIEKNQTILIYLCKSKLNFKKTQISINLDI